MYFLPLNNLFYILADLLQVLVFLIIAEVIVSWAIMFGSVSARKPWVITLRKVTDPVLEPFRRIIPPKVMGGLDISPVLAIILIQVLMGFLTKLGS